MELSVICFLPFFFLFFNVHLVGMSGLLADGALPRQTSLRVFLTPAPQTHTCVFDSSVKHGTGKKCKSKNGERKEINKREKRKEGKMRPK